jgi:fengycin family lipopeptide synthetase D/gramicidin S synthase 2/tyrocidine synthetase-2
MLSHGILTNLVQWQNKKTDIDASLRCLQFTSINFCVSFQEIIITLTAGGEVHLIGDIQRQDIEYLMEFLVSHRIEVLYLPFSYLNFLFNESGRWGQSFKHHLKHIITAGEQLKISAGLKKFLEANPRLKLHNHYGSSEMHVVTSYTLDASTADRVPIPPAGKPISNTRIYILDDYEKTVPIGVWGELFVSGSSEVLGYIHNSRLTDKKLLNHPSLSDDGKRLYCSGDLGRWLEDGNIELKGRKDDQVKVRGFRVEPGEIESKILSIDTVRECVVVVKTDERGNKYLVAYVVFDHEKMDLLEIKKLLNKELPQHMIPHLMVLESLPLMPNGKVDRERLPEPVLEKQGEYVEPRNKMEKQLVEIWSQVLEIEEEVIGIDDNFFDLGGHSLKATTVVSEILKKLKVKVPLTEMFKGATIRELSVYIRGSVKEILRPLEPEEKKEYYPLSSAQKRFYILHQLEPDSTSYNMPTILIVEGELYRERMESIFNQLIRRHEAYRTSFQLIENNPVQRIYNYEAIEFEIEYEEVPENEVKPLLEHFIRSFDLSFPPLLRVKFVKLENKKRLMMVDMHHILSDAVSMQLLVNDFVAFYKEETVPPLKLHYKDYSQWQDEKIISGEMKRQEEYWLKKFDKNIPVLDIPTDFGRPEVRRSEGAITGFEINGVNTKVLRRYAKKEEVTMFMVGLTLFNILLFKLTNQEDIVVGTITQGRQYPDLRHIIGIFINSLALRNYPGGDKTFVEFLREVRQGTLEAFDHQDYQFEDLVERVMKNRDAARNPIFDVLFSFSEKGNTGSRQPYPGNVEKKEQEKEVEFNVRPYKEWEGKEAKFDILLSGFETEEIIYFAVEYSTSLFKQETIERFGKYFQEIVSEVVKNETIKLKDINVSTRFGTEASDAFRDDESDFGF